MEHKKMEDKILNKAIELDKVLTRLIVDTPMYKIPDLTEKILDKWFELFTIEELLMLKDINDDYYKITGKNYFYNDFINHIFSKKFNTKRQLITDYLENN